MKILSNIFIVTALLIAGMLMSCKKKQQFKPSDYNIVFTQPEQFNGNTFQSPWILSLNTDGTVTAAASGLSYLNTTFKYEWDGNKTLSIKLAANNASVFSFDIENERITKAADASGAATAVFENLALQRKPGTDALAATIWKGNLAVGGTTYLKFNTDATALKYGSSIADLENSNNVYHPCHLIGNQAGSYKVGNEKWSAAVIINDVLYWFHNEGPGTSIGKLIKQ